MFTYLKTKLSPYYEFWILNALLATLIGARYFLYFPEVPFDGVQFSFAVTSLFSHMSLLALVFWLVGLVLCFLPFKAKRIILALLATIALTFLFIDTMVFGFYRFHLNYPVLSLVMSGQIVEFPASAWAMLTAGLAVVFGFQWWALSKMEVGRFTITKKLRKAFLPLFIATTLASHGIHIWAAATAYQPVSFVNQYLPLFYPTIANSFLMKHGFINRDELAKKQAQAPKMQGGLNYPLQPIVGNVPKSPKNIMLILIDSWRPDTVTPEYMPTVFGMSKEGLSFDKHYASGNATRMGTFGLFYGLPGPYWHPMLANQRSTVLMDRMQELDYKIGVFTSAHIESPEFNRTIFANIPNLRIRGKSKGTAADRDIELVDDWMKWYDVNSSKPTFSFLFFDAPHGFIFPDDYEPKFEPMSGPNNPFVRSNDSDPEPIFNRYRTSTHFVDSKIKEVVEKLKQTGTYDDTLIIVTGDHGEELNDNGQNFWGHNGNFTEAQVKVPFIMLGAGVDKAASQWPKGKLTTHFDLVPTLMKNYLGVTNDLEDYTVGEDLYGQFVDRPYTIIADYGDYAVVSEDKIFSLKGNGLYEVKDGRNRLLPKQEIDQERMQYAIELLTRYTK
ncbi:DUF3413 domain-containing protein [Vibrio sp. McD22-P3]|uniref:DUF3413 domain-containing protein n=1 Tax=Vibrio sp. McD22-P3 TaxID=2724880 RepID=UPI001F3F6BC7|nr:DUF3413 domain-containing protein [Vibrio sp. McD22-P3]MCF4172970.1 DUF3413 domain-containing protein [Vibrio sp. McD22-P3]